MKKKGGIHQVYVSVRMRCIFRCPVGGCMNENPIKKEDLVENKELKRYIEKKIRQEKKSKK